MCNIKNKITRQKLTKQQILNVDVIVKKQGYNPFIIKMKKFDLRFYYL